MATTKKMLKVLGLKEKDLQDPHLGEVQRRFDQQYVDPALYRWAARSGNRLTKRDVKVNLVAKHVALLVAKFHDTARKDVRGDWPTWRREVLPEVLVARTRLANALRIDLNAELPADKDDDRSRRHDLVDRKHSRVTLASNQLHIALGALFDFATPLEHGQVDTEKRDAVANLAVPALHDCGLVLAQFTHRDRTQAHWDYLANQLPDTE